MRRKEVQTRVKRFTGWPELRWWQISVTLAQKQPQWCGLLCALPRTHINEKHYYWFYGLCVALSLLSILLSYEKFSCES